MKLASSIKIIQIIQGISRVLLGLALAYAGFTHLTSSRLEFQAQVPTVLKDYADFVVHGGVIVQSGGNLLVFRSLNGQSSHSRLTINLWI
jgi:hypothetical protein